MNNQNRSGGYASNIAQGFNLVKMITGTPPQQVIGYPCKRCRWHSYGPAQIVINDIQLRSKSAVSHYGLYIFIASSGHNGDCRTHGISNYAQAVLWCAFFGTGHRSQKVVDLTITKRDRYTHFRSVPMIFKCQDIMA